MGRNWVPVGAVVVGLVFVLTQLTGSDVEKHVAQTIATALALLLFGALATPGVALVHWQPRLAPLGGVAATLSLLAGGATIVLTWSHAPSFFFLLFEGTSGKAAAVTDLLAILSAAACMLLATKRPGEDDGTRLTRLAAIGSLLALVALAILLLVVEDIDIGARVYGVLAAVFVIASLALLALRLLPLEEDDGFR